MLRRTLLSLALLLSPAPLALAQPLVDLLPAETVLAFGAQGLNDHADVLDDFLAEFERLEVGVALQAVFGDATEDMTDGPMAFPPELEGMELLDVIGQEAWFVLSISPFNPLPAVTALTRTSPRAAEALAGMLADHVAEAGLQPLQEGAHTFYQEAIEDPDSPFPAIAYAQAGDLVVLSSNPETLRAVLRLLGGSGEPSFGAGAGYAATLGTLGSGTLYSFVDVPRIVAAAMGFAGPMLQGTGFDQAIARLVAALNTIGVGGGVLRIVPDGTETESVQILSDPDSADFAGDRDLYNLLTTNFGAGDAALAFASPTALGVTGSYVDFGGWRNYLNGLLASVPELGITSLDELFLMLGLDIDTTFFSWAGTRVGSVTTGLTEAVEPGVAPANFLGEAVYLIEATDAATAEAGLSQLFMTVGALAASFADPMGGAGGMVTPEQRQVAGVNVTRFAVMDGVELSYAVVDGYALIATSDAAMDEVLGAYAAGGGMSAMFADMGTQVPNDARSFTISDNRSTVAGTAQMIASQIQLTAGLGGAADLDFDAVTMAGDRLEAFLLFVSSRLGGSYSYGTSEGGVLRSYGRAQVAW